ncbi:MAG TPA: MFS transporter [Gammaproteobacteria bacterium]|nr:MFS transporter [Gammaproteobacteria bacterium]
MLFQPQQNIPREEVERGLKLVIRDGVAAEMMTTLTGGAFLVAVALSFGASNFQIGLIAALPTIGNLFQLVAIWLLHRFANRRAITVICTIAARVPLLLIALLPLFMPTDLGLMLLIGLLFVHHFFGAISGTSWSSWMKDLVPEEILGAYFSNRSRKIQIVAVVMSILTASVLDYVTANQPGELDVAYASMFAIAGIVGLYGAYLLARTPEPMIYPVKQNLFRLFQAPLRDTNFRKLLAFIAVWAFAVNLAAPFFTVYMLTMLEFSFSWVIFFTFVSQISNIFFVRIWGRYSDKYSNKTVLRICAPIYLVAIFLWTFTTFPDRHALTVPLLVVIHIMSGMALSGINLALNNIGFKLSPGKQDAAVFLSTRSLTNAMFAGVAPVIGGLFADYFAERQLNWNLEWTSPEGDRVFHTLSLQAWDFFFITAFIFGLFALYRLTFVKEAGETERRVVLAELVSDLGRDARALTSIAGIRSVVSMPFSFFSLIVKPERRRRPRKAAG